MLDLVKRSLPVMVAATSAERAARGERDPSVYSDTRHLHYATLETEHPYKQAHVTHHKVSGWMPSGAALSSSFDLKVIEPCSQPLTAPAFVAMTTDESLAMGAWTLHLMYTSITAPQDPHVGAWNKSTLHLHVYEHNRTPRCSGGGLE